MFDLTNKTALVIGGAGLLGSEISKAFLDHGANVIIASRNTSKIQSFADSMRDQQLRNRISIREVDITNDDSVAEMVGKVEKDLPLGLDILVNSGWSGKKNNLDSITIDDWIYDIDVCLNGVFRTIKATLPLLKKSKGNILNIASMYGLVAPDYRMYDSEKYANPPSYGAAKAGVIQLTKYLASFLAKDGVRVNCISPGPFPFPQTQSENPEFMERLSSRNPLGRIGKPMEIQGAALLLCCNSGSYITGQNLRVDGGWTSW